MALFETIKQQFDNKRRIERLETTDYPGAWSFIADSILAAPAASVTFANLPQQFRHLVLTSQIRTSRAAVVDTLNIRFNGVVAATYDQADWYGQGNNVQASGFTAAPTSIQIGFVEGANAAANSYSTTIAWILGYARADNKKWVRSVSGALADLVAANVRVYDMMGTWDGTAAVTSITLLAAFGNLVAGSRMTLYGIL